MKRLGFVFFVCLSVASCDILRNGLFEVVYWSPGEGYRDSALVTEVYLDFSLEPDRNSVERSFSLSENGRALAGHFVWQESRMIFIPTAPLAANKDYSIILKTDAQDTKGLSLERQFEAVFTTRKEGGRPALLATVPEDGGIVVEERGRVELVFSEPLLRSSLQNLTFSPSISGVWSLEEEGYRAVFTPSENWVNGRSYRLGAGTVLQTATEMEAGRPYTVYFSAGTDLTAPELLAASALNASGAPVILLSAAGGMAKENAGWEREYRLCLDFSKPVDSASVSSALSCEPSLPLILETPPGYDDTFVYRFSEPPLHGHSYTISLRPAVRDRAGNTMEAGIIWHIRADGENSKPPTLRGLRFPIAFVPETLLVFKPENLFADFPLTSGNYTFDVGTDTWMELYFETAPGAFIDPLSLMDRFRFSATNIALGFSPRSINGSSFTVPDPDPGLKQFCRVEIRGVLTNHPYTGMVTIEVGAGLKDSLGNKSAEVIRILLLK